jgi:hypothetical protein
MVIWTADKIVISSNYIVSGSFQRKNQDMLWNKINNTCLFSVDSTSPVKQRIQKLIRLRKRLYSGFAFDDNYYLHIEF